ncbi:adhesion G- coupled receptor D1-like, partial [Paramuricea clavata]
GDKVRVREWLHLNAKEIETLSNGKEPMPPTKIYLKKDFDNLNKSFNDDFNVLLKTSFLAVEYGVHTFSSDCIPWCKIWIRRDICGTPELVLHQKEMGHSHKEVEYHVQRNYTMKFGTFYYLTIVHIGKASGVFKFQIEVKWPGEKKKKIPAVLLRLPPEKKCPKQPSIHVTPTATASHFVRQSPNRTVPLTTGTLPLTGVLSNTGGSTPTGSSILTGTLPITGILPRIRSSTSTGSSILTGTLPITGILSLIRSSTSTGNSILTETSTVTGTSKLAGTSSPTGTLTTTRLLAPTSVTQISAMIKSTPTRQYTTPSSSTTSPVAELSSKCKKSFQDCANGLSKILSPNEQTNQSSQRAKDTTGLSIARILDLNGQKFAENWNQSGKSKTLYYKKFVMEVSFPLTNYSFPRGNITDRFGKEFQSDQIFIPIQALATENGEFKRKVYSVLYLDLDKKMPRSINVVETETNQIPGSYQLNSHVIASTAVPRISGLKSHDIVIRLAHLNTNFNPEIKPMCVFLKWNNDVNSDGVWSTEGCKLDSDLSNQNVSVCRCNHLTHFGVLMQVHTHKLSSNDVKALKLISYIGCALSLIGAGLTMLAIMCLP